MAERRGYLVIALGGLVISGLLAALATYLAALLIAVIVGILRDSAYSSAGLMLAAPFYLAAAVLPFWAIRLYWSALTGVSDVERWRRSGWSLLRWAVRIYLGLAAVIVLAAWPGINASIASGLSIAAGLAAMAGVGLLAATPLIALLLSSLPSTRGRT